MGDTKIEWTEKTWNPIRARNKETGEVGWFCEHVSEGCRNCYAERMNRNTYFGNGLDYKPASLPQIELFLDEQILEQPLHWRKPQPIFPCSMTDLFGRWVKDEWLDKIHHVMWRASQHTFQILTKRADRMLDYMRDPNTPGGKPLPNAWYGVSCEDQKTADERIPLLLQTPAAIRWTSAEPLLGPVSLECVNFGDRIHSDVHDVLLPQHGPRYPGDGSALPSLPSNSIDWVVVGGESGPQARPMHPDWARSLRDQCVAADVPFFFKQWGEWAPLADHAEVLSDENQHDIYRDRIKIRGVNREGNQRMCAEDEGGEVVRLGKKAAGRLLDGVEWNQFPETAKAVTA